MSLAVGDAVSFKGQAHSKVTVLEVGTGNYLSGSVFVQTSFDVGTVKGEWVHRALLVPYGADTGKESPMGGRLVNPDKGRA